MIPALGEKRKVVPRRATAQPAGGVAIAETDVAAAGSGGRTIIDLIIGAAVVGADVVAVDIATVVLV
jgi:hypothetical protein